MIAAFLLAALTLRVDCHHAGNATEEHFAFDGAAVEGDWPGNPARAIDDTNLGKYFFEVRDPRTNRVLYSRGFASMYGEWELTAEARESRRVFTSRCAFPRRGARFR